MSSSRYQALLDDMAREFPGFAVVDKRDSVLHRLIDHALKLVTFGQMQSYLYGFQTTIGRRVYVTPDWPERSDDERYVTMRHERVHLRQFARWSLPLMGLLYVLGPLPFGLSYFRARWEKQGYEETIRAAAEVWGLPHVMHPRFRAQVISQFTSASYGWMWPFPRHLERWYDAVLARLRRELGTS